MVLHMHMHACIRSRSLLLVKLPTSDRFGGDPSRTAQCVAADSGLARFSPTYTPLEPSSSDIRSSFLKRMAITKKGCLLATVVVLFLSAQAGRGQG